MPIFGNDEQQSQDRPASAAAGGSVRTTQIAAGTKVVGEITGPTEVVIEGFFDGQIRVESSVTVGREGKVKGEIQARTVSVAGTVRGDIKGKDRLDVQSSGSVEGDVVAPRVVIASGAFFKGGVDMTEAAPSKAKAPQKAAQAAGGAKVQQAGGK